MTVPNCKRYEFTQEIRSGGRTWSRTRQTDGWRRELFLVELGQLDSQTGSFSKKQHKTKVGRNDNYIDSSNHSSNDNIDMGDIDFTNPSIA